MWAAVAVSLIGATTPAPPAAARELAFTARWNHGLFFETADKSFTAHVGGTVHYDAAWYTVADALQLFPGGTGRFSDGANLRRGRIVLEGTIARDFDYKLEVEFANGVLANPGNNPGAAGVSNSPGPTDAWMQWKNLPVVGTLRVGNQKEPFSLEHLESVRLIPFLERSFLFDAAQPSAFNNGRSPGVSLSNTFLDDRVYAAGGLFKSHSTLIGFGVGDGEYAATGRAGVLPVFDPDARRMLWVGGAASRRDPVNDQVQVRVREQVRAAPLPLLNLLANTGPVPARSNTLYNVEAAAASGPWSAQGEYLANLVDVAGAGTARFQGFYAQGTVLLTGEGRDWNPNTATWNRIVPRKDLGAGGGGAVELAARYSQLDASDAGIEGGRVRAVTVGLNWYWNPNMKVQLNYDAVYRDQAANPLAKGQVHAFGTRAAFDF